jgi:hypothetical protein
LLGRGISHRQAVLVLYGVSACFGLFSLLLLNPGGAALAAVLVVVGIGVSIGVRQLRYHEFRELGRAANRTLNARQVIANDISIRRATDALESCTNISQFCQILQQCLEPIGFDGFGLYLSSGFPAEAELLPCKPVGRTKLQFFWDRSLTASNTNWGLTLSLVKRNGKRLGAFTLYRKNTTSPLWMDVDLLTTIGFSSAVSASVEKILRSWVLKKQRERSQVAAFETSSPAIASRVSQTIALPSSG